MITEELKKRVTDFVGMEQRNGESLCMQISLEDVIEALEALKK